MPSIEHALDDRLRVLVRIWLDHKNCGLQWELGKILEYPGVSDCLPGALEAFHIEVEDSVLLENPHKKWSIMTVMFIAYLPLDPDTDPILSAVLLVKRFKALYSDQPHRDFIDNVPFDVDTKSLNFDGLRFRASGKRATAKKLKNIAQIEKLIYDKLSDIFRRYN